MRTRTDTLNGLHYAERKRGDEMHSIGLIGGLFKELVGLFVV